SLPDPVKVLQVSQRREYKLLGKHSRFLDKGLLLGKAKNIHTRVYNLAQAVALASDWQVNPAARGALRPFRCIAQERKVAMKVDDAPEGSEGRHFVEPTALRLVLLAEGHSSKFCIQWCVLCYVTSSVMSWHDWWYVAVFGLPAYICHWLDVCNIFKLFWVTMSSSYFVAGILVVGFSSLGCVSGLHVDGSTIGSKYIGGFNLAVGECTKACLELRRDKYTHNIYIHTHIYIFIFIFICLFICLLIHRIV
ncbi:unnamed protein product, partial [Symbiodinium necroappetens]